MILTNLTFYGKPVINRGNVALLNDLTCPECKKEMTRKLVSHDLHTMYTIISCDDHPFNAWEDIFDKRDIDTSLDYTNADKRFND